jgi:hypothetical protein
MSYSDDVPCRVAVPEPLPRYVGRQPNPSGAATVRFLFSINNGLKLLLVIFVVGFVAGYLLGSGV